MINDDKDDDDMDAGFDEIEEVKIFIFIILICKSIIGRAILI
jgi:hypothetical protein